MKLFGLIIETVAARRENVRAHANAIALLKREYEVACTNLMLANHAAMPREGKGESTRQHEAKMRLHNAEVALQRAEEAI